MSRESPHVSFKVSFKNIVFSAVLKTPTVALSLILFGSVFQAFAVDMVNDRACLLYLAAHLGRKYS